MVPGELGDTHHIGGLGRQQLKAIPGAELGEALNGVRKPQLTDAHFDGRLPKRDHADGVARGFNELAYRLRLLSTLEKPQDRMGVEEQPQGMYSSKSLRGSSK